MIIVPFSLMKTFEWSTKVTLPLIDSSSSMNLSLSLNIWLLAPLSRYHIFSLACLCSSWTSNKMTFFFFFYNKIDILLNLSSWIPVIPSIMTYILKIIAFNFRFVKPGFQIAIVSVTSQPSCDWPVDLLRPPWPPLLNLPLLTLPLHCPRFQP
jgi:hypothetical protein